MILLIEMCMLVRYCALCFTLGTVLRPKQCQSDSRLSEFVINILIVRKFTPLVIATARIKKMLNILVAQGIRDRPSKGMRFRKRKNIRNSVA